MITITDIITGTTADDLLLSAFPALDEDQHKIVNSKFVPEEGDGDVLVPVSSFEGDIETLVNCEV